MTDKGVIIINRSRRLFILFLTIFLWAGNFFTSLAQNRNDIRDPLDSALELAQTLYQNVQSRNSLVYTGRGYYDAYSDVKGHQFFYDDYWELGNVTFDENTYKDIFLRYDINKDLLMIENFNSNGFMSPIKLYSPKVKTFELHGFKFIRLERDTVAGIREGFYNLLYDSDSIQVLIKRRKEIVKSNEINSVQEEFIVRDRIYIRLGGNFHRVRKRNSILKIMIDRKKDVKRYIKQNQYDFKNDPEMQIVDIVKYYDSLS